MARVARDVSPDVSRDVSAAVSPAVSKAKRVKPQKPPAAAAEEPRDPDDADEGEPGDLDDDLDAEDEAEEAERELLDDDCFEDPDTEALNRERRALADHPYTIAVRQCYEGPDPSKRGLTHYRGQIVWDDVAQIGSLREAVRRLLRARPGMYVVQLFDPAAKKRIGEWQSTFRIEAEQLDASVEELRRKAERLRAEKVVVEVGAELEDAKSSRTRPQSDRMLALLEGMDTRLKNLEQVGNAREPVWMKVLSSPVALAIVPKLILRLFPPAQSAADMIGTLAPLLTTSFESNSAAQLAVQKSRLRREEELFASNLRAKERAAGVDPEENEPGLLDQALKLITAFRGGASAPSAPVAPRPANRAVAPRERRAITPFMRFANTVMRAYDAKATPGEALKLALAAWDACAPEEKVRFLDPSQAVPMFGELPTDLRSRAERIVKDETGWAWVEEFHKNLVEIETPAPDEASDDEPTDDVGEGDAGETADDLELAATGATA